ncbi:MAG: hypothetical protein HRT73_10925, partial [Flavobacteriales bacterium]|nr:hypothetical protein [Flavobacteriales bacterium]
MIDEVKKKTPIYFDLHELYLSKKEYDKSIEMNKKILLEHPEEIKLYINLGNAYMLKEETVEGLKYFEIAALKLPLDYVLLQNVANVFRTVGDEKKALYYEIMSKTARTQFEK